MRLRTSFLSNSLFTISAVVFGLSCTSPGSSSKEKKVAEENTGNNAAQKIYSAASIEEGKRLAREYVIGTWTYTGQAIQLQHTYWFRWVVKPDGTVEQYSAAANAVDWGVPTKIEKWEVVSDKFTNTGKRYYAFNCPSFGVAVIQEDGTLRAEYLFQQLQFVKGDIFPFSK